MRFLALFLLPLAAARELPTGRDIRGYLLTFGGMDPRNFSPLYDSEMTPVGLPPVSTPACPNPFLPLEAGGYGTAHGIVSGEGFVCGGGTFSNVSRSCHALGWGGWTREPPMGRRRMSAAFTSMDADTFWVAGGHDGDFVPDATTEMFSFQGGWTGYVNTPEPRREACLARIDDDLFFFGGGLGEDGIPSPKFWLYRRSSRTWTAVPDLFVPNVDSEKGIAGMACVAVTQRSDGRQRVIVTGGRFGLTLNKRTWIYNVQTGFWSIGRSLDLDRQTSPAIPLSPSFPSDSFLTVGIDDQDIYRFTENRFGGNWTRQDETLLGNGHDGGRFYFGAVFFERCPTGGLRRGFSVPKK